MHKLKLHPETLAVESFVPAPAQDGATGTVRGHNATAEYPCHGAGPTMNCQETGPGVPTCNDSCYDLCTGPTAAHLVCIE
jgi:hypothetical protein